MKRLSDGARPLGDSAHPAPAACAPAVLILPDPHGPSGHC